MVMSAMDRLPIAVRALLADPKAERYVSVISAFEMAVKHSLGKLPLPAWFAADFRAAFENGVDELAASVLEVGLDHAVAVGRLPFHHRDPFDRLLIAQAMEEDLTIISTDRQFAAYQGLKLLPA